MIKVNAIVCPECNQTVYSRTRHDYRSCRCKAVAIDGGFDYIKVAFMPSINPDSIKHVTLELDLTKADLYNDWNTSADKYGVL